MMTKQIKLAIEESTTGVAGFPYGQEIFTKQVKNQLSSEAFNEGIEIVLPDSIERITSSFVQGFFSYLIDKYGYYGVKKNFSIKTSSKKLSESVFKVLE